MVYLFALPDDCNHLVHQGGARSQRMQAFWAGKPKDCHRLPVLLQKDSHHDTPQTDRVKAIWDPSGQDGCRLHSKLSPEGWEFTPAATIVEQLWDLPRISKKYDFSVWSLSEFGRKIFNGWQNISK